jgi:dTMP kinase
MTMKNRNAGKLISFEGIDGCGKSSAAEAVKNFLESKGVPCLLTRQPGGTELGEKIRDILKHHPKQIDPLSEVMLLIASFQASNQEIIKPFLASGGWVLLDRYTDSTIAYQSGGKGVNEKKLRKLIKTSLTLKPCLTLYFDLPPEEGLKRAAERGLPDNFEKLGVSFQNKIRKMFLKLAKKEKRIKVINTFENCQENTKKLSIKHVKKLLKKARKGLC